MSNQVSKTKRQPNRLSLLEMNESYEAFTIKTLAKKATAKIVKLLPTEVAVPANPLSDLIAIAKGVGVSLKIRVSEHLWQLTLIQGDEKFVVAHTSLTEAINSLIRSRAKAIWKGYRYPGKNYGEGNLLTANDFSSLTLKNA